KPRVALKAPLVFVEAQIRSATTGSVVTNVGRADLKVTENGVPQDLFSYQRIREPLSVSILVDASPGEANTRFIESQMESLGAQLDGALEAWDEVSVIALETHPVLLQDYTNDRNLIRSALAKSIAHSEPGKGMPALDQRLLKYLGSVNARAVAVGDLRP